MAFISRKKCAGLRFAMQYAIAAFLASLCTAENLNAEIRMHVGDLTMTSGTVNSLDIYVTSTTSQSLMGVSYKVMITPISEFGGRLLFADSSDSVNPASVKQSDSEVFEPNYIFTAPTGEFLATRDVLDDRLLIGTDFLSVLDESAVWNGEQRLLARIEVFHMTDAPAASTGVYQISIVPDGSQTIFLSGNLDFIDIDEHSYSQVGTINVVPNSIPEPSSMLLTSVVAIGFLVRRRVKEYLMLST